MFELVVATIIGVVALVVLRLTSRPDDEATESQELPAIDSEVAEESTPLDENERVARWAEGVLAELEARDLRPGDEELVNEFRCLAAMDPDDVRDSGLHGMVLEKAHVSAILRRDLGGRIGALTERMQEALESKYPEVLEQKRLRNLTDEEFAVELLGRQTVNEMLAYVDRWAEPLVAGAMEQSTSYGFEQESAFNALRDEFDFLEGEIQAKFFPAVEGEGTLWRLYNLARDHAMAHTYDLESAEPVTWFGGFQLVGDDVRGDAPLFDEVPELVLLLDGPGLLDCCVEAAPNGINLSLDLGVGFTPHTAGTAEATKQLAAWAVENSPWDEDAMERVESDHNNIGWLILNGETVVAFDIFDPPSAVLEWIEVLRSVPFQE